MNYLKTLQKVSDYFFGFGDSEFNKLKREEHYVDSEFFTGNTSKKILKLDKILNIIDPAYKNFTNLVETSLVLTEDYATLTAMVIFLELGRATVHFARRKLSRLYVDRVKKEHQLLEQIAEGDNSLEEEHPEEGDAWKDRGG